MLLYKENKLICPDFALVSAESVILLESDIEANFFGVFTLQKGETKTVQFQQVGELYKARVQFFEEELGSLEKPFFHLQVIGLAGLTQTSNKISVVVDPLKLSVGIRKKATIELNEITRRLVDVERTMNNYAKGNRLTGINIVDYSFIKKGMIPVAIDDKGNFMPAYPFSDVVKSVNKVTADESNVTITADNIPFNEEKSVGDVLRDIAAAIEMAVAGLASLVKIDQELNARLVQVETDLAGHLDNAF